MSANISFFKVSTLPTPLVPNAFYFVKNDLYAESYLTDEEGIALAIGNSSMIAALIAAIGIDLSKFIENETPTGVVDGINPIFTSLNPFVPGTVNVFLNGLKQDLGIDYSTSGSTTIRFIVTAPLVTEKVSIDYIKQ